jgi:tRNA U55 pseudouridine synthase TruB
MRSLAYQAGKKAGTGAFAYHIKRTQIASYTFKNALHLPF